MLANFAAITLSPRQLGRVEGWRVMFYAVACIALVATLCVLLFGIEPRYLKPKQPESPGPRKHTVWQAVSAGLMLILRNTWQVFRIRSFQIIMAAGIVGTVAFVGGMGYRILYFQVCLSATSMLALSQPDAFELHVHRVPTIIKTCWIA